tara:strand:+ start:97 stop:285 length:189 start_codon:yes stop_codon:yes gene_type:complete
MTSGMVLGSGKQASQHSSSEENKPESLSTQQQLSHAYLVSSACSQEKKSKIKKINIVNLLII